MKVMKKPAASKPNAPLTKRGKGSLTKGTKKGLKKGQLAKLGKMTLAQKVAKAAAEAETAEEAANNLKGMLAKDEHSKIWSKHKTFLKGQTKKVQSDFEKLPKLEKGMAAALHLIKATAPKFMQTKESVTQAALYDKKEVWESELQMVEKFGEEEFWQHVESGRIAWRIDPWTPGVYNYCDQNNISKTRSVRKARKYTRGQEYHPTEEDDAHMDGLWNLDSSSHLNQVEGWGKGKSLTKGKGKGNGHGQGALTKGKGKSFLAIKDKEEEGGQEVEKSEEDQWKELLAKAKKARDHCNSAQADCEAAMECAEKAKRLTKAGKKDTEGLLQKLGQKVSALKLLLAKGDKAMKLDKAKKLLVETGTLVKEVKEETRELTQLANKAGSRASKP